MYFALSFYDTVRPAEDRILCAILGLDESVAKSHPSVGGGQKGTADLHHHPLGFGRHQTGADREGLAHPPWFEMF